MKKIIVILSLFSLLVACGDNTSNNSSQVTQSKKKQDKLKACSVLSEDYIKSTYPAATGIKLNEGGSTFPFCAAQFVHSGSEYGINLTLGAIGGATDGSLEASVSYFRKKSQVDAISGVGEKAYFPQNGMGQISALNNGNLIHVSTYKDNIINLELAKKSTNDFFKILN